MGTDYHGVAVVGVRLCKEDLYDTETVKAFDHDFPADWRVCPKTGRKLWREVKTCVFGEDFEFGWDKVDGDIETFSEGCGDGDYVYIGKGAQSDSNRSGAGTQGVDLDLDKVGELKDRLKGLLQDLYDEEEFKVWAILSYG